MALFRGRTMCNSMSPMPGKGRIMQNNKTETENQTQTTDKQCTHPRLIREYAYGGPTGNFICLQCECLVLPGEKRQLHHSHYHELKNTDYPLRLPAFIVWLRYTGPISETGPAYRLVYFFGGFAWNNFFIGSTLFLLFKLYVTPSLDNE